MGIEVYWKDERGEILAGVEDAGAFSGLGGLLYRQSGSVCLRFIDPAGDACFNQRQLPILLMEFRQLLGQLNGRPRDHVQAIVDLLEGAARVHTYIWFVGD